MKQKLLFDTNFKSYALLIVTFLNSRWKSNKPVINKRIKLFPFVLLTSNCFVSRKTGEEHTHTTYFKNNKHKQFQNYFMEHRI